MSGSIAALRTPDERFDNLPDYAYRPHYLDDLPGMEGLRIHYLDEGPTDAEHTVLCLHGQPTWSYLYRKMLPVFVAAGQRVIAPDLAGFGRSDKPTDERDYTFHFHRDMLVACIEALDLENVTLVCQDWGGILGMTIPPAMPERFNRLLVMNTAMPVGKAVGEGFEKWRAYNRSQQDLNIAALMKRSCPAMSDKEAAAYEAPYPDARYKAGVRRFPELVMTRPEMDGVAESRRAASWWRNSWQGQSFMAVGMQDPVLGGEIMTQLRMGIRGCPPPYALEKAGHFVQEDGAQVARAALRAFAPG